MSRFASPIAAIAIATLTLAGCGETGGDAAEVETVTVVVDPSPSGDASPTTSAPTAPTTAPTTATTTAATTDREALRADLIEAFRSSGGLDQEVSTCLADALLASDLTDEQLIAVAQDDESLIPEGEQDAVIAVIADATADCLGFGG